ncbi:MAG: MaoC family dehydratase [Bacillota bacterium]|nr:MaoC family dehydratase [Bacillota bacterium]
METTNAKADKTICHIGDKASISKTFTQEDLEQFADLTLDDNGIHTDPELAAHGIFRRPVIHGVLVSSLISSCMGTKMPGHGAILQAQDISYAAPVYPGDTVTVEVTIKEVDEQPKYYIATIEGICTNQDGVEVARATSKEMMLKRFFEIE